MYIPRDTPTRRGSRSDTEQSKNCSNISSASLDSATPEQWDKVSKPHHYSSKSDKYQDLECINFIEAALTPEEFKGYCKGNVLKYSWRCDDKGATMDDLRKARKYLDWLIEQNL